ncbi:MAG: hypothetical protein WDZ41_02410 [Candidatus Babeliales bacterium]
MFSLREKRKHIISVHLNQNHLACYWLEKLKQNQFEVRAYQATILKRFEFKNLITFNSLFIKSTLQNFIKKHNLKKSDAVLSLGGPGFIEQIINLGTEIPQIYHLNCAKNVPIFWDYQPMSYVKQSNKTYYYCCAITKELLFQQQLIALMVPITYTKILSQRISLLHACNYFFPDQLAHAVINNHASLQNSIRYCIDQWDVESHIINFTSSLIQYKQQLFEAIGAYLAGISAYERI